MAEDKKTKAEQKRSENYSFNQRLYRSETNKIIAGVCGGLGEYFEIDPTIIRIIFVLLSIFGGSGIIIYLILWIVMPTRSQSGDPSQANIRENVEDMKNKFKSFASDISRPKRNPEDSRFIWAIIIIVLGFVFLFNNFGIFDFLEFSKIWPVLLIVLGLTLILKR